MKSLPTRAQDPLGDRTLRREKENERVRIAVCGFKQAGLGEEEARLTAGGEMAVRG